MVKVRFNLLRRRTLSARTPGNAAPRTRPHLADSRVIR
jgi:hypothetical protein